MWAKAPTSLAVSTLVIFSKLHLELSRAETASISNCAVSSPPALRDARLSRYDISSINASSASELSI